MKRILTDYFEFSKKEFRTLIILIMLIVIVSGSPLLFQRSKNPVISIENLDSNMDKPVIHTDTALLDEVKTGSLYSIESNKQISPGTIGRKKTVFIPEFNPNKVTLAFLDSIGISQRVANNWLKYLDRGGSFQHPADLAKIYGMDPETEQLLKDCVLLPHTKPRNEPSPVDINLAGQADWESLKGIGPYFARRIIRFRNALGGFYSVEQVAETYGLKDSIFQAIRPFLFLSYGPKPLDLNTISLDTLTSHPYINYKQARAIIHYRNQHQGRMHWTNLYDILLFDSAYVDKISPYFRQSDQDPEL